MWLTIFDDLHKVMYMSIKPYENIKSFKECGRKKVVESFEWHKLVKHGHNIFGITIVNFGMLMHFHYLVVILDYFTYATFSFFELFWKQPNLYPFMHYVCFYRIVDDWSSMIIAFQTKYTSKYRVLSWSFETLVFPWKQMDFERRHIDWLVWRLTTTIAWHYKHTTKMEKQGFIKK